MIGASLSGVTFMSVPGWVGSTQFTYLVLVLGYLIGYAVIATVLMPLYYKLNLITIYSYLEQRLGFWSYKTGAFFFLLSRTIGASFRMFLVVNVLQLFVFDAWHIPFAVTVSIFIGLIILYTLKGGIKTIIWTDTLQTTFMLLAVGITIYLISKDLHFNFSDLISTVWNSDYSKVIETDWHSKRFFLKQLLSGAFIAIVMTGLDQEMMQKNLSCKNLRDAQKNMFSFSFVLVFINLMFLFLGAVLFLYSTQHNIPFPERTDDLFPILAIKYLSPVAGIVFLVGLISAAYPSADGALTSLTTSFSIDFLNFNKRTNLTEKQKEKVRHKVHFAFALVLLFVIVIFRAINNRAVVDSIFTVAGYTYGPLLGLFSFGLFTRKSVIDKWVPYVAVASPVVCFLVDRYSEWLFNGYKIGFELLLLNGFLTFIGLLLLSKKQ
jgi:Na+/proline symporter